MRLDEAAAVAELTVHNPPAGYPHEWERDAVLKDGATIRIRPIVPGDRDALQALVGGLSRESSYFRFFRVKRELEPSELDRFTQLDYSTAMAFVAVHDRTLVGVGRYSAVPEEAGVAEVAFAVADDHQKRGIGTLLAYRITAYARLHEITAFRAFLLADNHVMMRVFRNAGFTMRRQLEETIHG